MPSWRSAKAALFQAARATGALTLLRNSQWRTDRLLILAYHGTSFDDEHEWNPSLYMPPDLLRERLEAIRRLDCHVLPLGEAIERLYEGTLPPRSVAITVDDGTVDFYERAWPVLREFSYPVTLYWTTYYAGFGRPVPDVALPYLLWKGNAPPHVEESFRSRLAQPGLSAVQKDELLAELAGAVGIDYEEFCRRRLLQIMTPDEAADLVRQGVDIELHTHRHRTPNDRALLLREFEDNRRCIEQTGAVRPVHFCYPNGYYAHFNRTWIAEAHISSAVTCDPALATRDRDRLDLPRFVDTCFCDNVQFEAWLSGLPQLLPRRRATQFAEQR